MERIYLGRLKAASTALDERIGDVEGPDVQLVLILECGDPGEQSEPS